MDNIVAAKFTPEIDEEMQALLFGEAPPPETPVTFPFSSSSSFSFAQYPFSISLLFKGTNQPARYL